MRLQPWVLQHLLGGGAGSRVQLRTQRNLFVNEKGIQVALFRRASSVQHAYRTAFCSLHNINLFPSSVSCAKIGFGVQFRVQDFGIWVCIGGCAMDIQ